MSAPSSMGALFKIERRQVLEQRREEKKKLSAPTETYTNELIIGTQSSCGLRVDDPIAAATHCSIAFRAGRFVLLDLGNVTGTFLNGERVLEPTPVGDGDRITLGVTTIEVAQDFSVADTLSIAVHEGAFFHTAKKRGEFESDADEWVRSEVTFGRAPRLVALNALAIVFAASLMGWLWLTPGGQAALQPGHLSAAHAQLFAAEPPTAPHLAAMVEIAREQGCAACHDTSGTPTSARCASCHSELVQAATDERAHPFVADDALDCVRCHKEHFGAVPPPDTVKPAEIAGRCVNCHGIDFEDEASVREGVAHAVAAYGLVPSTDEPLARVASLGFEAFDHARHSAIDDCATCHELRMDESAAFDFESIAFEACMACHGADADAQGDGHRPGTEFRWDTTWHGAGDAQSNCRECHVEPFDAALAMVEMSAPVPAAFTLLSRSHHPFLTGTEGPGDCSECHKSGELRQALQSLGARPFRHEQHLSPIVGDASREIVNAQCAECHTDMLTRQELTRAPGTYDGPPIASCATCHNEAGDALITLPGVTSEVTSTRRTAAFPHDRHTAVEGGCVTCHEAGGAAAPVDVATCVRCHVDGEGDHPAAHVAIGGGDCVACHKPRGDGSASSAMAAVFYGPLASARVPSAFRHALGAHRQGLCVDCHGDPREGSDVRSPQITSSSCRECHAQTRFHWR